jgi:hypothetical protein
VVAHPGAIEVGDIDGIAKRIVDVVHHGVVNRGATSDDGIVDWFINGRPIDGGSIDGGSIDDRSIDFWSIDDWSIA